MNTKWRIAARRGARALVAVALVMAFVMGEAMAGGAHPVKGDAVEKEIRRVAAAFRAAVVSGNQDALLALVSAKGMACQDVLIPKATVEHDLRDGGSGLHALLFDTTALTSRYADYGLKVSWRDMFRAFPRAEVFVRFEEFPGQEPYGFPCASFVDGDEEWPGELCFVRSADRWWLTDSLYKCR